MDDSKEMEELAQAAGYEIIASLISRKLHKVNYITETKSEELLELITLNQIDAIVFNEPVSLRYMQKIEELIDNDDIILVDKPMLILDIFSVKSSSAEIQLQIKMAQLKYSLPRIRQEVGVTLRTERQARERGTGESVKDIMQSDARSRISQMEAELREFKKKYSLEDEPIPSIPILGNYSVGKSTLFNIITSGNRDTGDEAFTTMILKSSWSRILGYPIKLIDTIGLVDLPPSVTESFSIMLERIFSSKVIIVAIDGSDPKEAIKKHFENLNSYYESYIDPERQYRVLFIVTKCDLITEKKYNWIVDLFAKKLDDEYFPNQFYDIIGTRSDNPQLTEKSFKKSLEELLKPDLMKFTIGPLQPSEVSTVYDWARVENEEWKEGQATLSGFITRASFDQNLSKFKEALIEAVHFD